MEAKKKYAINLTDVLIALYLICFSLRYLTNINVYIILGLWCFCGTILMIYLYSITFIRSYIRTAFLIDLVALLGVIINGNHTWLYFFILITVEAFGFAIYIKRDNLRMVDIWAVVTICYIEFRVIFLRFSASYFVYEKVKLSNLLGMNTASIMVIFLLFIDTIYRKSIGKKPRYVLYLLVAISAILCGGNGNILSLALLASGIFLVNRRGEKIVWHRVMMFCALGLLVVWSEGLIDEVIQFLTDDHDRFWVWNTYFDMLHGNWKAIFFGVDISRNFQLSLFGHMHNTFINWHFYYGLIPFLFFAYLIILIMIKTVCEKQYFEVMFMVITVIRGITDETTLIFMPIWIYLYVKISCCNKNNKVI